jgi:hypothetical protein
MQNPSEAAAPARAAIPLEAPTSSPPSPRVPPASAPREVGGPAGPEPTRYGDWERNGRCIDF